jgi:hypothetical protein
LNRDAGERNMNDSEVILIGIILVGSVFGVIISRRIKRQIDSVRIRDQNRLRELTTRERIELASRLAWQRGHWLSRIAILGAVMILACVAILWGLGFFKK